MMENVATLIIIVSPCLLFVYWFRYACLLILTARTVRDYGGAVATANQLDFPKVQWKLQNQAVDLDRLKDALDRDHELLIYLLKNAEGMDCRALIKGNPSRARRFLPPDVPHYRHRRNAISQTPSRARPRGAAKQDRVNIVPDYRKLTDHFLGNTQS